MTDVQAAQLLLDLGLIVGLAAIAGLIARGLGQPAVIGEIVIGILVGPTLFHGAIPHLLFPTVIKPYLTALSNVGIVLFMFAIGLELDRSRLRGSGRVAAGAAIGASLLPFGLGCLLSLYLIGHHTSGNRLGFMLYTGVALSVTAFPVLARILTDRGMSATRIGSLSLSTAAVCDVAAWCALGVVQAIVGSSGESHWFTLLAIPYVLAMFLVVRPALRKLLLHAEGTVLEVTAVRYTVLLVGLLVSAAITQLVGLHFIFGAFLFGLAVPKTADGGLLQDLTRKSQAGITLLLPVYFVVAGLNVDLSKLGGTGLLDLALIMVVAIVGKAGGAYLGARSQGLANHPSVLVATLMNTRGLTELIVLGVGLQAGLLDQSLYSEMVVMAVVTTAMSGPLLQWLVHRERAGRAAVPAFEVVELEHVAV